MDFSKLTSLFPFKRRRRAARSQMAVVSAESLEKRVLLTARLAGDFNADGYDDMAIGVEEKFGNVQGGAVSVVYGSDDGLTDVGNQLWHQNRPGIQDKVEDGDSFGIGIAIGDYNNDGYDDLAVSAPFENIGGREGAGAVHIIFGSADGLTSSGAQFWHQNSRGIKEKAEVNDAFGARLATGDFDNDGVDDLGVSAPGESVKGIENAGAVHVLFGTKNGLTAERNQLWHQNSSKVQEKSETNDFFGLTLAAGDFDGNGADDLAVGVPLEDLGTIKNAGVVNVLYGRNGVGLTKAGNKVWHQNIGGVNEVAEGYDGFGLSLTVGDFNGNGKDDLAIGVPGESVSGIDGAGGVNVIYGTGRGLRSKNDQFWSQNSSGIKDRAENIDAHEDWHIQTEGFGSALSAGDFDNNGTDDLAIGVPGETVGGAIAGAVNVIYSQASGLRSAGNQMIHQNVKGIPNKAEMLDGFGTTLASGNFDGASGDDLVIGAESETLRDEVEAGTVNDVYSSPEGNGGLDPLTGGIINQNWRSMLDRAEGSESFEDRGEYFGFSLPGSLAKVGMEKEDNLFD